MKVYNLKKLRLTRLSLPKLMVLATGLAAAGLVATMSPQAAQATPRASSCAGCHNPATAGTATATPSSATPAAGASYTVAITLVANPNGGKTGYGIVPVAPATEKTFGGNTGTQLAFTATMVAPSAAGTYSYTVWTNQGITDGTARVGSVVYSITVPGVVATPTATSSTTATATATATATSTATSSTTATSTTPPVIGSTEIHGPFAIDAPQCASCHRGHNAEAPNLLVKGSQSSLCFSCHDGTAANANVQAHYALVRPTNNPATREFYSHDALAKSDHTQSALDEFGGVSNRHSECADCHDSHNARPGPDSAQTVSGWDASGRLAGVSGVSVVNGAAGSAPQYTFLSGIIPSSATNLMTREYQLCFKCHSGFTKLTDNTGLKPSQYALDKAVELNPANPSFHPVEAAGKNQTPKMAASLLGTSPYKLWNFTPGSTIRCLNCHASSETPDVTAIPAPEAGGPLAPHTSVNRGILLRNYKDRVLKTTNEAYSAGDFALCYVCHGEAPFSSETATATNFKLHGLHVSKLAGKGSGGTDIDTPGAGQGNATCAECHFRLHSTTNKVGTQAVDGSRLVNFAPNVMANGATLSWTSSGIGSGSCTLTCHGEPHSGYKYSP